MRKFILLILLVLISAYSCNKNDPDKILNDQMISEWERVSDSILANTRIPGMIVGIWAPDRDLQWVTGKSKANVATGEKPVPTMKFRIGSITKTYTYTVLLQLTDESRLNLSDKLNAWFPDFPMAGSITVRMLCNHTSGIPDYTETMPYMYSLITNPLKKWTGQELADLVKSEPFYFSPGTDFKYSNTNTILAGLIIEQITGNSLATEIQQRILDPLHLINTSYPSDVGPYRNHPGL